MFGGIQQSTKIQQCLPTVLFEINFRDILRDCNITVRSIKILETLDVGNAT